MSSLSFGTIEGGKMCKHKQALKGKMIRGIQMRSSPNPSADPDPTLSLRWETQSSAHFSHGQATHDTKRRRRCWENHVRARLGAHSEKDCPTFNVDMLLSSQVLGHFTFHKLVDRAFSFPTQEVHPFKSADRLNRDSNSISVEQIKEVGVTSFSRLVCKTPAASVSVFSCRCVQADGARLRHNIVNPLKVTRCPC